MKSRSRYLVYILLITALLLTACSPDVGMDLEDLLDPEGDGSGEEQSQPFIGEGSADVYYHHHVTHPDINFKIDMPFKIHFDDSDQSGSFDAQGIYQDFVTFQMGAGTPQARCQIQCQVELRFVAEGSIELGEKGECEIPIRFSFVPQAEGAILTGNCPHELMDVLDCAQLSMVLQDPDTYTFLATDTELYVPSGTGVTREAEIKNLVFPSDMKGTCTWKK